MDTWPRVGIVVLNWNGMRDTLACLGSLAQLDYPAFEALVVDNGSSDGSVPVIHKRFPWATIIENGENLGYTGGNNVGLRQAMIRGMDYALLLNNDTEVATDFLSLLVNAAEAGPTVGVAGPTIYYHDRPNTIWSAGGAIDWWRGRTRMVGLDEDDVGQFGHKPRAVDFVTGCALLIKRRVLDRVGLLDDRFFAYYEEAEWCVRVRRARFEIAHVPQAHVWHKIHVAAQADSPLVHYYMTRNRLLFLKASRAGLPAWLHTLFVEYLRSLVSWSLQPKWRGKRAQRRVMLQAIGDAWRGHWGKRHTLV